MKTIQLNKRPLIISGPCSAETEAQVMQTAVDLKATGKIDVLRAGIWKPRTRPNSFEGIGEIGLKWLADAGKATGLPVITEVANTKHVEAALKAGFNALWIGARTTVNPFAVQEIAEALQGTGVSMLVKNPINPDLNLWIGAIERLKNVGLTEVNAIHRGFSSFNSHKYRNEPMWEIPLALKHEFPDLKLICDPSHIAGNRVLLQEISQKAMDLLYDGLMIESHIDPDNAWSDAKQQITPQVLLKLINDLILRDLAADNLQVAKDLKELRSAINEVDSEIISLLAKRMNVAESIGLYKKQNNITILQPKRWEEIQNTLMTYAESYGLSQKFVKKYLDAIHQESIRHQTVIMNK